MYLLNKITNEIGSHFLKESKKVKQNYLWQKDIFHASVIEAEVKR